MYNVEEGQESSGSNIQYIKPGINIVSLKEVNKGTKNVNGTEVKVAIFTFENKEGGKAEYVLFPFNSKADWIQKRIGEKAKRSFTFKYYKTGVEVKLEKDKTVFTQDISEADAFESYSNEIKHIRNRFDSTIAIKGATFEEMVNNLIIALKPFFNKKEIKLAAEKYGKYTNIKKYVPFLSDLEDTKTLESLTLKLEEEAVTPDTEDLPVTTSTEDSKDW